MTGYLLDTNVLSALAKEKPHPAVMSFLDAWDEFWLSAIVLAELELGVQLLPEGRRRNRLRDWVSQIVAKFEQRLLPVERREAEWAALFQARVHSSGRALELADALIAGTAMTNDLAIATRNVKDFADLDVEVVNPWEPR